MATQKILFFPVRRRGLLAFVSQGSSAKYPLHTHVSTYTVGYVRKGSIRLRHKGKKRIVQKGGVFVIGPDEPHSLEAHSDFALINVCVDLSVAASRNLGAAFLTSGENHPESLTRTEVSALGKAIDRLPRLQPAEDPADALHQLKRRLEQHPQEKLELADMARMTHIDKFHLIRKFRSRYGLTPMRFLAQSRVRMARRIMLRSASLTLAALDAGFYDQSHFIREFRRIAGMPPGKYRAARKKIADLR